MYRYGTTGHVKGGYITSCRWISLRKIEDKNVVTLKISYSILI